MRFRFQILKSIVLCLTTITLTVHAQSFDFFKYGVEKGLSQETINTILKDSQGFLWLGTQDGLNRFDGHRFRVFKSKKKDTTSISGNFINALAEDQLGRIWIATKNNGLCYYTPTTDTFSKFRIEGLPDNAQCNKLILDNKGHIFAAFLDQGLAKISIENGTTTAKKLPFFNTTPANITALQHLDDTLWVGTRDGDLYYANALNFKLLNYDFNGLKIHSFAKSEIGIWIGADDGLYHLNLNSNKIKKTTISASKAIAVFDISNIDNQLYLATDSGFINCSGYNSETNSFSNITTVDTRSKEETGLSTNRINCVVVENDFLWLGADKLYQLSLKTPVFQLFTKNKPRKGTLENEHVYTFAKSDHGLWAGTLEGLHLITETQTFVYKNIPHNTVRSIAIDTKNNLWIGTQKGVSVLDLSHFNPEKPNFITVTQHSIDSLNLSNLKIRHIHTDTTGNVWVSTLGGGTHRFIGNITERRFEFQQFKNRPKNDNSLSTNVNYVCYRDRSGALWVGTEKGLNRIRFNEDQYYNPEYKRFISDENNNASISSNTVLSILEDTQQNLWIGTLNGLNKFNKTTGTFTRYNEDFGLTNGVVYAIRQDESGMLWLSTNSGIFSFDPNSETFTNYNKDDGLQGNEFNLGGSFKDADHNLYFGGTNGYNVFNPKHIDQLDNDGDLTFTTIKIKDANHNFKAFVKHDESKVASINLSYDQFPFYLEFSDLDFSPQKNNFYVYKLSPNDAQWNDLQKRKDIQFLNLSPGEYTLLVQGKTRGQLWNTTPLKLNLNVTPPWWKTHLAFTAYGLLLATFIYVLYYFQLQKKLQEQETQKLKELDALKTKLYTNITHEFRTPLTVIKGITSNLSDQFQRAKDLKSVNSLKTIEHNSDAVLKLVNQMLDLAKIDKQKMVLKPSQSDLGWYLNHIVAHFASYAESKGVKLTFYSETKALLCDFDPSAIQKIMSNLLSNAIKNCSQNDQIITHLKAENNSVQINVKDSGKGISKEHLDSIFDRFYQVENSVDYSEEGSGIGLTLVKELVQLMNGTIDVDSELHVGTTFNISFPCTQKMPKEVLDQQLLNYLITPTLVNDTIDITETSTNEKAVVLAVDDNADILNLLETILSQQYNVVLAKNGEEGVSKAIEHIPDVIISDVMMPKKNGFELCHILKNDEKTSHIPIILLTAKASEQDKIKGLSNGADAFITKPFNKAELFIRIQELIKLRTLLYQKFSSASSWDAIPSKDIEDKDAAFMNKVLYCIEQHLDDAAFNSMRLSRALELSESQLYRKLKAITDASTAVFIRRVRLQKAKTMLQNSDFSISEIAYKSGFNSPGWFSRAFKEEFGYAPNEMRK